MPLDVTFSGIQMPTLLVIFFTVALFQVALDRLLVKLNVYEYVWHPGIFRTALFVCLFSIPCLMIYTQGH